jgi:pyruvate ferredoxin oxidoreductase beta subunit
MIEILAAHQTPYVASTSIGYPLDFMEKVRKAAAVRGPSYIHCHAPCPTGWGIDTQDIITISKLAVETGCVVLFEIENGVRRLSRKVTRRKPVEEYLKHQARFRHVIDDEAALAEIQRIVDERFEATMARMSA